MVEFVRRNGDTILVWLGAAVFGGAGATIMHMHSSSHWTTIQAGGTVLVGGLVGAGLGAFLTKMMLMNPTPD